MQNTLLNLSHVHPRVKETLERRKYEIIDGVNELRYDGTTRHHLWVKVDIDGQGDVQVFHIEGDLCGLTDSSEARMAEDIQRFKKNNISTAAMIKEKAKADAENEALEKWLKDTFGDTLPDRNCIATIRRYLSDNVLNQYANGKRGVDGVRAQSAFFNTKAYARFYAAIK